MELPCSTYFVIARLQPAEECKDLNPGELPLSNGWVLDIYSDLLCIWNPSVSRPFAELRPFMSEALDLVMALYVFRSGRLLGYQLRNWIECKDIRSAKNIIGAFVPRPTAARASRRVNVSWKRAAKTFQQVYQKVFLRVALKDYVSALRDRGDDAFFFAYRAVESICRGISSPKGE